MERLISELLSKWIYEEINPLWQINSNFIQILEKKFLSINFAISSKI